MTIAALDTLKQRRPEWSPWLAVIEETVRELTSPRWDSAVPEPPEARDDGVPLLSGSTIAVDAREVRRTLERLADLASRSGTPKMASVKAALRADVDLLTLYAASIRQQGEEVAGLARACGADEEALQAVVSLLGLPLLHACRRRWSSAVPAGWTEGYCPLCGSWPAFAEVRGIERSRYARCGRCGVEWFAPILRCAYCGTDSHDELVSLVPDTAGSPGAIDACRRCQGYVKTFTRLQGCAPAAVMLEDLGSVDLDVAALEQGYARPSGPGCAVDVHMSQTRAARRLFVWNP
jgi:FdhE protein